MTKTRSTSSYFFSLAYTLMGYFLLRLPGELCLLGGVILFIAALLPDIDSDPQVAGQEVALILSAIIPLVALEFFPSLNNGGVSRLALIVVMSYLLTKVIFVQFATSFVAYRGILHSIPAAIITFDLTYLLFKDLDTFQRLYISVAALVGFLFHLLLEAYNNLDMVNQALGKGGKDKPVMKLTGATKQSTMAAYVILCGLSYVVFQDLFPALEKMKFPD